jgi:hypothetical protein
LIFIRINKKLLLKVCLCTIGKKENLYAYEFVEHYKKIGYDKIFIYDNNDIGDEKFEDVLNKQISSNFVEIINFRGYRGKRQKPQNDAYFHCYEKNLLFVIILVGWYYRFCPDDRGSDNKICTGATGQRRFPGTDSI